MEHESGNQVERFPSAVQRQDGSTEALPEPLSFDDAYARLIDGGKVYGEEQMRAAYEDAERAIFALVQAAGWKLVPAEPTHDMLSAMAECDGWLPGDRERPGLQGWEDYWRVAYAAAPLTGKTPRPDDQTGVGSDDQTEAA